MRFHRAVAQYTEAQQSRVKLDQSYDEKLDELRRYYEQRKSEIEQAYLKAENVLEQGRRALGLADPRVTLGSRVVRVVGDWSLAGRDGRHCCEQAALSIARTNGECLGRYSYCTLTKGAVHGVYDVLTLGQKPEGNGIPLFRVEGTPEVMHRLQHGTVLPDNVVEAAVYFVHHLPELFALGWKWREALSDDRDLFAANPAAAEALAGIL